MLHLLMRKKYYFFKLIPPRPSFPQDITNEERLLMDAHARHFREFFDNGKVLVYGPVLATGGAFGMAVLEVADETEARQFAESDPSVRAGMNRFELSPMQVAAARGIEPQGQHGGWEGGAPLRRETVTDAADGVNVAGTLGIVFELLAERSHVDVNGAGPDARLVGPHPFQQFIP